MFVRSAKLPASSSAGYICLACRHERSINAKQFRNQQRWNSDSAKSSAAETVSAAQAEAADDWILPLNSFSEDYGSKRKRPAKKEPLTTTVDEGKAQSIDGLRALLSGSGDGDGFTQEGAAGSSLNRKQRREERRRARDKSSPASTSPASTSPASTSPASTLPTSTSPNDVRGLLQVLEQANSGDAGAVAGGEGAREKVGAMKGGKIQPPPLVSTTSSHSEMQALWDSLGPEIRAEIDELAAEGIKQNSEAQYDDFLEKTAAVSVPKPEVKSKEPVPFPSFSSDESIKAPAPSTGFFSSTIKYFKESFGLVKPSQPIPRPASTEPAVQAEQNADDGIIQRSPKQQQSVESTFDTIQLPRYVAVHKSPIERLEESSSRSPWGTSASAQNTEDRRIASFEDIASADRVSVKQPIATSISARPFGSEPADTIASLRVKLAQDLAQDKSSPWKSGSVKLSAFPSEEKTTTDEAAPALSRLSGLYATRKNHEDAPTKPLGDGQDTLDLAYLRRQHDQERAQEDIKQSMMKSGLPVSGSEIEQAIRDEANRTVEGESKTSSKTSDRDAHDDSMPAPSDTPVGGLSLGDAMRARPKSADTHTVPKRRASRTKSKTQVKNAAENQTVGSTSQDLPPAVETTDESDENSASSVEGFKTSAPSKLHITPLDIPQPPVPFLQYGLDRVLFNPGVYQLQDQTSRVYNFDPYLQNIMPNVEFDFDSLKEYKTSSKDEALAAIAKEHGNRYIGSTSSMTSAMGHFHYLLSNWRPLNYGMLSNDFVAKGSKALPQQLTQINRAPSAIFLRWKNGTYAIDADKEHDSANVLMLLGKSMELLLTLPKSDFERYRKSDPREVTEEQRTAPESYQYTTMRDFLMRSQLDAYDPRLPGNGTFDLKTRAVVSVRMAADDHEPMTGYEIYGQQGKWGSYEKEYYDMMRSTMLKYMLQARMGRMTGIFVAYHNVERMFGFQYIPIADMDRALHGQTDPSLGDQEFRASLDMMNEVFNAATTKFPEQSLRIHFETLEETKGGMPTALHVFAEPMSEEDCDKIQNSQKAKIAEWERTVMGKDDPAVEDAQGEAMSFDEMASKGLSNEVVQDDATVNSVDQVVDEAEEHQATASTLIQSSEEDLSADGAATQPSIDTSSSNADPQFLNALDKTDSEELQPLFYATIIASSTVNGQVVERPQNLGPEDEWNIDYILKEYEIGRKQWAMYEDVKARRKMAYVKEEEEEGVAKEDNGYITFLRKLSEEGRALRKAKDDKEDGLPIVRVEDLDMERLGKVESVEDYMRFLEKPKEEGTREMFG